MRRGFPLSTPRGTIKDTSSSSCRSQSQRTHAPEQLTKQENKTSIPLVSTLQVIPIPDKYVPDPPIPETNPNLALGLTFKVTQVPEGGEPPQLVTSFTHCAGMLDALRVQYPGWPQPFSTPSSVYEVVPVPGTGLGMVATVDVAPGETILRERPLLVIPSARPCSSMEESLRFMGQAVYAMHPENRRAFFAHANCKGKDAGSQVRGIIDTNAFVAGSFPVWDAKYGALARDASRINHSCKPNAMHDFDIGTLTHVIRAVQPIRAGEEITISYLNEPLQMHDARQEEMSRRYGFKCRCQACRLTGHARVLSDIARFTLLGSAVPSHTREHDAAFRVWLAQGAPPHLPNHDPETDLHPLELAEMLWTAMVEEGCYSFGTGLWESVLLRLVEAHSALQDEGAVRYYAAKAAELRMAVSGSDGGWRAVAEKPRQTKWWAKLSAKRRGNGHSV